MVEDRLRQRIDPGDARLCTSADLRDAPDVAGFDDISPGTDFIPLTTSGGLRSISGAVLPRMPSTSGEEYETVRGFGGGTEDAFFNIAGRAEPVAGRLLHRYACLGT